MRTAVVSILALLVLAGVAQANSDFTDVQFSQRSEFAPRTFDQHIQDEVTGDEFKRWLDI